MATTTSFGSSEPLASFKEIDRDAISIPEEELPNEVKAENQAAKLPTPRGWKVLLVPYSQPKRSKGGIHFAESTIRTEEIATSIGYVVALGPEAYSDETRFPSGPWCKTGDYVVFGRYAGLRLLMRGNDNDNLNLRMLNDDEILAVLPGNPEDYVGVS